MRERGDWEGEVLIESGTGRQRVADTSVTSISSQPGHPEGFVVVLTDVTERIERKQTLRSREQELDLLRQVLTRYLRHNLRNDLNVILGHGERLAERLDGEESEAAATIVHDVVSEVEAQYPGVKIDVNASPDCRILARDGIREAIGGLVENAARHNDADDPWIRIDVRGGDGAQVVIEGVDGRLSFDTDETGTRAVADFPPPESIGSQGFEATDLKARERRLRTITDRMTDAILEVDAAGAITFLDRRAEEILGVEGTELRGRQFWEAFGDARGGDFEAAYWEAMEDRISTSLEAHYDRIDSWLEIYIYPNFDGGLSFYFRDVTDRKQREEDLARARSRMELALNVTDAAVWEWNVNADAVTVPRRYIRLSGRRYDRSESSSKVSIPTTVRRSARNWSEPSRPRLPSKWSIASRRTERSGGPKTTANCGTLPPDRRANGWSVLPGT